MTPDAGWRWQHVVLAPHRLAFFLALLVLVTSAGWWAGVHADRLVPGVRFFYSLPPRLTHAGVMTFGFFPLFFSGFLFTAVPKWLRVQPPTTQTLLVPLVLQATGWMTWLAGAHLHAFVALAGLVLAWVGLVTTAWLFSKMVAHSDEPDRVHARILACALWVGCVCLAGLAVGALRGDSALALAFARTGLWGFVVLVFSTVAHRLIAFLTSESMPWIRSLGPFWVLYGMVFAAGFESLSVWVALHRDAQFLAAFDWPTLQLLVELMWGGVLLWVAVQWARTQRYRNRMLHMLHTGFLWLGLGLVIGGVVKLLEQFYGTQVLDLGALHAVALGGLCTLMLAMVTRITCAQSGRASLADQTAWPLFWLLQVIVVLRVSAGHSSTWTNGLLGASAVLWLVWCAVWSWRLTGWLGRPGLTNKPR